MPLHPVIVHFPIALIVMAVIFQLLAVLRGTHYLRHSAWITLGLAAFAAMVAALTGTAQERLVPITSEIDGPLRFHRNLGSLCAWLLVIGTLSGLYLQLKKRLAPTAFLVALLLLAALVLLTGYTGGELVYRYGVGIPH